MAGRIRDEDIALVRERARIDDVVREYVTLKSAGGGSVKGLCPFHDERSPSFHVTPSRGMWYCFGCGEGGDVISFVMKVDGLTFTETVERLAEKVGVQLRREEGDDEPVRPRGPARGRLVEAHKVAQEFYAEQLASADAVLSTFTLCTIPDVRVALLEVARVLGSRLGLPVPDMPWHAHRDRLIALATTLATPTKGRPPRA